MKFTAIDPEVAKATLARKQRSSKHRDTLQAFWEADIPAAQLELEPNEDGTMPNRSSVTSGLNQAIGAAKENKVEWAHHIQVRNRADGVFLINKRLMAENEPEEAEADNLEPVEA